MSKFSITNSLSDISNIVDEIETKDSQLQDILDQIDDLISKASNRVWADDYEAEVFIRVMGSEDYFKKDRFYCYYFKSDSDDENGTINFPSYTKANKFINDMKELYPDISYLVISESTILTDDEVTALWRNPEYMERWQYDDDVAYENQDIEFEDY